MNYDSSLQTKRSKIGEKIGDLTCPSQRGHSNQVVSDKQRSIVPVILAGGLGTRLWPLSREMFPKQFVPFFGDRTANFFGATLQRLHSTSAFSAPLIVCNNAHRFLVRDEVEHARITPRAIILEPLGRNTASAIAVAALYVEHREPGGILAVMPSDHVLRNEERFVGAVKKAAEVAACGKLVLFGVPPTAAHTGYGYIRQGAPLDGSNGSAFAIRSFVEKPDRATAETYFAAGGYHWNSGVFVMSAETFIRELASCEPAILEAADRALTNANEDLGFLRLDGSALAAAPNMSVDRAVMERTSAGAMLTLDCGWSDMGSWASLWEISPRDESGNAVCGEALLEDTADCYVHCDKALVATLGVRDLIIVGTPDALLVAEKTRAQEVTKIVSRLRKSNRREFEQHSRNLRPWGHFESLSVGTRFQVKLLSVKPGAKLSLQMHHYRSEHWTIVSGTARVTIGDVERLIRENESVYIPATEWHRLANPGKMPLEVIEVQIGSYLGEDDIVRSDDIYNRSPDETR
jgi:mannose-1-phosphate guanylyltransferase/mannose-6-phosphate isomerase